MQQTPRAIKNLNKTPTEIELKSMVNPTTHKEANPTTHRGELLLIACTMDESGNSVIWDSIKYNIFNQNTNIAKSYVDDINDIQLHQINFNEFTPIVPGSKSVPKTPRPMETPRPTSASPRDMKSSASVPIFPTSANTRTVESLRRKTVLPLFPQPTKTTGGKTLKRRKQRKHNKTRTRK